MEISSLYQSHGQLKSPQHLSLIMSTTKLLMPSHQLQRDHQLQHQLKNQRHPQRPQQLKKKQPRLEPQQHQTIQQQHSSMQKKITNCHPMKMLSSIQ